MAKLFLPLDHIVWEFLSKQQNLKNFQIIKYKSKLLATQRSYNIFHARKDGATSPLNIAFSTLNLSGPSSKDTHRENTPSNKTKALTKRINMGVWEICTLN